jgi:hypothetical protein
MILSTWQIQRKTQRKKKLGLLRPTCQTCNLGYELYRVELFLFYYMIKDIKINLE